MSRVKTTAPVLLCSQTTRATVLPVYMEIIVNLVSECAMGIFFTSRLHQFTTFLTLRKVQYGTPSIILRISSKFYVAGKKICAEFKH